MGTSYHSVGSTHHHQGICVLLLALPSSCRATICKPAVLLVGCSSGLARVLQDSMGLVTPCYQNESNLMFLALLDMAPGGTQF